MAAREQQLSSEKEGSPQHTKNIHSIRFNSIAHNSFHIVKLWFFLFLPLTLAHTTIKMISRHVNAWGSAFVRQNEYMEGIKTSHSHNTQQHNISLRSLSLRSVVVVEEERRVEKINWDIINKERQTQFLNISSLARRRRHRSTFHWMWA